MEGKQLKKGDMVKVVSRDFPYTYTCTGRIVKRHKNNWYTIVFEALGTFTRLHYNEIELVEENVDNE